jgi:hypothetical protein
VSVKARVVVQAALLHNHVPGVLVVRRALLVEVQRDRDLANAAIDAALGVARQLILRARVRELVARTLLFASRLSRRELVRRERGRGAALVEEQRIDQRTAVVAIGLLRRQ